MLCLIGFRETDKKNAKKTHFLITDSNVTKDKNPRKVKTNKNKSIKMEQNQQIIF